MTPTDASEQKNTGPLDGPVIKHIKSPRIIKHDDIFAFVNQEPDLQINLKNLKFIISFS